MITLHPTIRSELLDLQKALVASDAWATAPAIQRQYDAFRRAFGPDALRALDGRALLERMHSHGSRDSMVYWLEFKNDDEFQTASFGSIAGGSALKFGVYRRAETGTWARKGSGPVPKDIELAEAIDIAERHRDQLLLGVELLTAMRDNAADSEYETLQQGMRQDAPEVEDTAWAHKYFSLLFPRMLDDFHVESFQRYNLVRLLQLPANNQETWIEGRYAYAGRFVSLSALLELPTQQATTLLNRRHGTPKSYWRIGTTDDQADRRKYWNMMREGGFVAIGWPDLGDLSTASVGPNLRTDVVEALGRHYPNTPQAMGNIGSQITNFVSAIADGDRVVPADGQTALGIGEISGPYRHDSNGPFPHRRPVTWRSLAEWKTVDAEALRTTVGRIRDPRNLVEIERRIIDDADGVDTSLAARPPQTKSSAGSQARDGQLPRLTGVSGQIQTVLQRKGQAIVYGPPGTGKTYWAVRTARELAGLRAFGLGWAALSEAQQDRITIGSAPTGPLVRLTTFHPDYGYEDFLEGYRPDVADDGSLRFRLQPGVFRELCSDAASSPGLDFYLVIDEINRGDIPRIFGELLTLLEKDKRQMALRLSGSGNAFSVPANVHVIGTMNTADRSIALLDIALRRRFGFVELMPDYSVLGSSAVGGLPLAAWLEDLNRRIRQFGGSDARNRQIGHAFLLGPSGPLTAVEQIAAVLRDDIVPLLEEYAYDDFEHLTAILGSALVDQAQLAIRKELFEPGREQDLISALSTPEIATAGKALVASEETTAEDDDEASPAPEPQAS